MYDLGVARADARADCVAGFQNDNVASASCQSPRGVDADHAGTDDNAVHMFGYVGAHSREGAAMATNRGIRVHVDDGAAALLRDELMHGAAPPQMFAAEKPEQRR